MNLNKTKYQIFPKNTYVNLKELSDNCIIKVRQASLKEVKLYKYLGVKIDTFLTMKQHANNLIKLGPHKPFMLRHVRKMITMQATLMIFKSVFMGVLDYGYIFVSSLPEQTKEDIQILQNNALCSYVNTLEMHANANVQLFKHRMIQS